MSSPDAIDYVLDTNVLLECRFFPEVDWLRILDAKRVRLAVSLPVLSELEKHKRDRTSRRRQERAKRILREFDDLQAAHPNMEDILLRRDVTLHFAGIRPNMVHYADLDPHEGDDLIIAVALSLAEKRSVEPAILSLDHGMRVRARHFGLAVPTVPEEIVLADEPDEVTQENRRLKQEVEHLLRREPQLRAAFLHEGNEAAQLTVARYAIRPPTAEDYARALGTFAHQLSDSLRMWGDATTQPTHGMWIYPRVRPQADVVERVIGELVMGDPLLRKYAEDAQQYLRLSAAHLAALLTWERIRARAIPITLRTLNSGSSPAEDATVEICLPDDVLTWLPKGLSHKPLPRPLPHPLYFGRLGFPTPDGAAYPPFPVCYPDVDTDDSPSLPVGYHEQSGPLRRTVGQIMHNVPTDLLPFTVVLRDGYSDDSLTIECVLHAGNRATPARTTLHITLAAVHVVEPWRDIEPR